MKHLDVRNTLINSTISVIANEGLDKTTTKAIVGGTDINEAYIYRFFQDKENLIASTFEALDQELVEKALQHIPVMYDHSLDYETRCRLFFMSIWRFLLGNREKCIAYIRYYYSPYFRKYSSFKHKKRFEPLINNFYDAFKEEANVWMLMNHILNVLLDFAVKIFDGAVSNNDSTAEHVFRLIYNSIKPYFKNQRSSDNEEGN